MNTTIEKFASRDAAHNRSEELKHLWKDGLGLVTGPFIDAGNKEWYEVQNQFNENLLGKAVLTKEQYGSIFDHPDFSPGSYTWDAANQVYKRDLQ